MSVPISGPRQVQAIAPWAFCLQGHQVGPSIGVVGSPPRHLVMSLILYRPIIWLAIVILHYIQVYYHFYVLENSPQYSSYTEFMDFIQILCFTPKAHRNLFFFQEIFGSFYYWIHNACYMVESYVKNI